VTIVERDQLILEIHHSPSRGALRRHDGDGPVMLEPVPGRTDAYHWPCSMAEYHAARDVWGHTRLELFYGSAAECKWELTHAQKPTRAMFLGTVFHWMLLAPEDGSLDLVIEPEGADRRTKEYKAWFASHGVGRDVIGYEDAAQVRSAVAAVRRHKQLGPLLEGGLREQGMRWTDPITGLPLKTRPDLTTVDYTLAVDFKLTSIDGMTDPRRLAQHAASMGWHRQLAHYSEGIYEVTGVYPSTYLDVFVELDDMHRIVIADWTPAAIRVAKGQWRANLDRLAFVLEQQKEIGDEAWRDPAELTVIHLDLPPWEQ